MTGPEHLGDEVAGLGRVCIMGARGLLGGALRQTLRARGIDAVGFSRQREPGPGAWAIWDPAARRVERDALEGADVVVNLVGEDLSRGRWTAKRKQQLWSSRVDSTAFVVETLAALVRPPRVLVNASAVGYYGDRGDEAVDEDSPRGDGFLARLCDAWETAAAPAREYGVRVVTARYGVVLTPAGGALATMLGPFRAGLGGRLGNGRQRFPWVTLPDAVAATCFTMTHAALDGPVNVVAPESVTNGQFTQALGHVLGRPTLLGVPAFALRAALGELAGEALLVGANVRPRRLEVAGYNFEFPRLEDALAAML